ncbi:hypothetical protein ILYODFUR_012586 [Ilyodon furcidens]|uniref:Uncharacterized protein n=1 Tax=Ilyodon furcidens TaxID=33524 RepID=A0ABV0SY46_9TELE
MLLYIDQKQVYNMLKNILKKCAGVLADHYAFSTVCVISKHRISCYFSSLSQDLTPHFVDLLWVKHHPLNGSCIVLVSAHSKGVYKNLDISGKSKLRLAGSGSAESGMKMLVVTSLM